MKEELVKYFAGLEYGQQRKVLAELHEHLRKPTFSIKFKLAENRGLLLCARVAQYCTERGIQFKTEQKKNMAYFHFEGLSARNAALIGGMIK